MEEEGGKFKGTIGEEEGGNAKLGGIKEKGGENVEEGGGMVGRRCKEDRHGPAI